MGLTNFTYAQIFAENVDDLVAHLKRIYSTEDLLIYSPIYNLKTEKNCIYFDSGGYGTYTSLFQGLCEYGFDYQVFMGAIHYDCQDHDKFGGYVFSSDEEELLCVQRLFELESVDMLVQEENEPWSNFLYWIYLDDVSINKIPESSLKTALQQAIKSGFKFLTTNEIAEANNWENYHFEGDERILTYDQFFEMTNFLGLDDNSVSNLMFELGKHAMELVREDIASELEWFIEEEEISCADIDLVFDFKNFDFGYINGAKWLKWPSVIEDINAY